MEERNADYEIGIESNGREFFFVFVFFQVGKLD